jgi:hypothetical protein
MTIDQALAEIIAYSVAQGVDSLGGIEQMVKRYKTLTLEQQQAVDVFMAEAKEAVTASFAKRGSMSSTITLSITITPDDIEVLRNIKEKFGYKIDETGIIAHIINEYEAKEPV